MPTIAVSITNILLQSRSRSVQQFLRKAQGKVQKHLRKMHLKLNLKFYKSIIWSIRRVLRNMKTTTNYSNFIKLFYRLILDSIKSIKINSFDTQTKILQVCSICKSINMQETFASTMLKTYKIYNYATYYRILFP